VAAFAGMMAPFLDQLAAHLESRALLEAPDEDALFRQEAIEAQALPRWGDVIRVAPSWVGWAYWGLLALLVASIAYISLGTVSTYSSGPAIVRSTSREEIAARLAGNVIEVAVNPGDRVAAGGVIARLDDADARGSVVRLEREFDNQLRNHMQDPADQAADAAVRGLRLQLGQARLALEDRLIRSSAGGVITDVRVRGGQHVEPGNVVATVAAGEGGLEVAALLPGSDRPQLAPGMPLRLELAGYRYAYQTLTIDSVSTDVLAPAEALRVLGVDGLQLSGPVVLVRARIAGFEFEADGDRYRYHDGMQGLAEVRVRDERILYTLMPELRRF
jgi:multidrug efflux pump subunit AcrA (membrane-fusion protein)